MCCTAQLFASGSLKNTNEMLSRYPGADGVKTGWTDAGGLCLVTSATRDGHRLISVVLNAPYWYNDSGTILDYGFAKLAADPKLGELAGTIGQATTVAIGSAFQLRTTAGGGEHLLAGKKCRRHP